MKKEKTIVYGDVVEQVEVDPNQLELGCQHGRRVGQPCPHCLGIGSASPNYYDKVTVHVSGVEVQPAPPSDDPIEQGIAKDMEARIKQFDAEILKDLHDAKKR